MRNLWNRFCTELYLMLLEAKAELKSNSKTNKGIFAGSTALGAIMNFGMIAIAADEDLNTFKVNVIAKINELYGAAFPIITAFAVLMAAIAFVTRMTANQQKAAQATSWLVRIAIAYVGLNAVGLIARVIYNTMDAEWREMPTLTVKENEANELANKVANRIGQNEVANGIGQ